MGKNKQKTAPDKYKSKKTVNNRPKEKQQNDLSKSSTSRIQKNKSGKKTKKKAAAQLGKGLGSNLIKGGFDLGSKALGSEFGKKLINKGIDNIPSIFKFGVSKIKNKNVKKALSSQSKKYIHNFIR